MKTTFIQDLRDHIAAGFSLIHVPTCEFRRVEAEIAVVADSFAEESRGRRPYQVVYWDAHNGFSGVLDGRPVKPDERTRLPHFAANCTIPGNYSQFSGYPILFVFRDLDDFFSDPTLRHTLRNISEERLYALSELPQANALILVTPKDKLHDKVSPYFTTIEFSLPTDEQLTSLAYSLASAYLRPSPGEEAIIPPLDHDRDIMEQVEQVAKTVSDSRVKNYLRHIDTIVKNLRGLTYSEAENILAMVISRYKLQVNDDAVADLKKFKAQSIAKSQVLTYIPDEVQASPDEIGGFDNFLSWLGRRALAYAPEARKVGLDYPKGVVLVGVPGTGKSYVGRAAARLLDLPGYILDFASVFGSLVGESEQRMREALRQIEAQRGCVVLVDEADKVLGGVLESSGDSGVTRRVFGQFLSWMAEPKKYPVFVIMTLNRTKGLPPELLRAGRFDAIFYTDLPDAGARRDILAIHLRKRGVDPDVYTANDWKVLCDITDGLVGSELEQLVVEARMFAYQRGEKSAIPSLEDFHNASGTITPISMTEREAIDEIRSWCESRALPVASSNVKVTIPGGRSFN